MNGFFIAAIMATIVIMVLTIILDVADGGYGEIIGTGFFIAIIVGGLLAGIGFAVRADQDTKENISQYEEEYNISITDFSESVVQYNGNCYALESGEELIKIGCIDGSKNWREGE